jgi:hypothetical protein
MVVETKDETGFVDFRDEAQRLRSSEFICSAQMSGARETLLLISL